MIPVRVALKNFLCFDTDESDGPVIFDFDGSNLWSIAGDNGAGKSAIFDAVRYSLFGQHRGGKQRDNRLVRKGASRCEMSFEFDLAGRLYRINRTVPAGERGEKTYQAAWYDEEAADWRPVPQTDSRSGLEAWVKGTLKLDATTFTASTMLLQGESDRLLNADAEARFDILAGLLDLGFYKKLEALARERAKTGRARKKDLAAELQGMESVSKDDVKRAEARVKEVDAKSKAASKKRDSAFILEKEAHDYSRLSEEARTLQVPLKELSRLLLDSDRIEKEFQQFSVAKQALPMLERSLKDIKAAEELVEGATQAAQDLKGVDLLALRKGERSTKAEADRVAKAIVKAKAAVDGRMDSIPIVRRVLDARTRFEATLQELDDLLATQDPTAVVEEAQQTLERLRGVRDQAKRLASAKTTERTRIEVALSSSEDELAERLNAKDEGTCSRCGQPVDAKHIAAEVADLRKRIRQLKHELSEAKKQEDRAEKSYQEATNQAEKARDVAEEAKSFDKSAQRLRSQAEGLREKLDDVKAEARSNLSSIYHKPIFNEPLPKADSTLKRLEEELSESRSELRGLEEHERRARTACETASRKLADATVNVEKLRSRISTNEERVQSLRKQAELRVESLSSEWRSSVLSGDGSVVQQLQARVQDLAGVEKEYATLQKASTQRDKLERKLDRVEEARRAIPKKSRIDAAEATRLRNEAEDEVASASANRDRARDLVAQLTHALKARQKLEEKMELNSRETHLYGRLTDLLGRSGVQAVLIDDAVNGIAQLANETLARISGGTMQLWIDRRPGRGGKEEIVIEATDLSFSDDRLDINFISGGQKFRVAVSLAAAIGQYVGGAGSVHSLIIDEGFGSLDAQGRQQTVDELRNLSQVMDRIIVVSHQEDFQDRTLFPTGYVLTKEGRRTLVERFV